MTARGVSRRTVLNVGVVGGGVAAAGGLFARSQAAAAEPPVGPGAEEPKNKPGFGEFAALPPALKKVADTVSANLRTKGLNDLGDAFTKFFSQAWRECMIRTDDEGAKDGVFVITGDIPAMWLRDSAVSVRPYLAAAKDPAVYSAIAGVLRQQVAYVNLDPYANAFRRSFDPLSENVDIDVPKPDPRVHERKYEVDSLCAPLLLAHALWRASDGNLDHVDDTFLSAAGRIIGLWWRETRHESSPYTFRRGDGVWELQREGKGPEVAYSGMTWSGFRPSDDPCSQGYLVPANAMAVLALQGLAAMAKAKGRADLEANARNLGREISRGIAAHGRVAWPTQPNKKIYAFEVSGPLAGGPKVNLDDDANIPSLLSLPYLGFCSLNDPTYVNTRARALSFENKWYFEGEFASGIGSSHTPRNKKVWPLALIMQALTTTNEAERRKLARTVLTTNKGGALLHESFEVDDPYNWTRRFFNWPNALYSELLMEFAGYDLKKLYPRLVN